MSVTQTETPTVPTAPQAPAFDPRAHVVSLGRRGGKEQLYLEVRWRLVWFREQHPDWGIETELLALDLERQTAVFRARVVNAEGRVVATGTKMESAAHFGDYAEKAETGAIGRALAVCGFGTQFSGDLEEGSRIVDSPVTTEPARKATAGRSGPTAPAPRPCEGCGATLTAGQVAYSEFQFSKALCPGCQR